MTHADRVKTLNCARTLPHAARQFNIHFGPSTTKRDDYRADGSRTKLLDLFFSIVVCGDEVLFWISVLFFLLLLGRQFFSFFVFIICVFEQSSHFSIISARFLLVLFCLIWVVC